MGLNDTRYRPLRMRPCERGTAYSHISYLLRGAIMDSSVHIPCPACGTVNRVPESRLDDGAICGSCKQSLFSGRPIELDSRTFDIQIGRSGIPVVVDFWAPWCGPCISMAPHFTQAAASLEPRIRFAKLDTETVRDVAGRYGIRSI